MQSSSSTTMTLKPDHKWVFVEYSEDSDTTLTDKNGRDVRYITAVSSSQPELNIHWCFEDKPSATFEYRYGDAPILNKCVAVQVPRRARQLIVCITSSCSYATREVNIHIVPTVQACCQILHDWWQLEHFYIEEEEQCVCCGTCQEILKRRVDARLSKLSPDDPNKTCWHYRDNISSSIKLYPGACFRVKKKELVTNGMTIVDSASKNGGEVYMYKISITR